MLRTRRHFGLYSLRWEVLVRVGMRFELLQTDELIAIRVDLRDILSSRNDRRVTVAEPAALSAEPI